MNILKHTLSALVTVKSLVISVVVKSSPTIPLKRDGLGMSQGL